MGSGTAAQIDTERLEHRAACREEGRISRGGTRPAVAVVAFARREDTRSEPRGASQGPFHTRYLHHVDADTSRSHAALRSYSTVTDFARLRGLSTSQPRSSAT